jgi:spermidine/putrescine transport system substrate-binding protein
MPPLLVTVLLLCAPSLEAVTGDEHSPTAKRELIVLNWSEYLDPELVEGFEKEFDVDIREVYFASDDLRDAMMLEMGGTGYDVVLINGVNIDAYRRRGWLAPLLPDEIPALEFVDSKWFDIFPSSQGYAIPYFWGTLGIAYRKDMLPKPITSWRELYDPAPYLRGKISIIGNSRDAIGMALKTLGYSANSSDKTQLREAEQLLLTQKPFVTSYNYLALTEESAMVTGEIIAAMVYSGDVLMLRQHHPDIEYAVPSEGGNLWVDYWTVMEASKNKDLAKAFLNYLNEPENAAALAEYVSYATPNKAAELLLPEAFLSDPVIYPSPAVLEKSEAYTQLSPRAERIRNLMITRLID